MSAPTYDLIKEFGTSDNVLATNPFWIVAVLSYKKQATYARTLKKSGSLDPTESVDTEDALIITSDCVHLDTNTNKNSHMSSLSATLLGGHHDYMSKVFPGDWVFAWVVNSEASFLSILSRLKEAKKPCNEYMDGLKFMGRVQSMRKNVAVEAGGVKHTRYALSAIGFQEFDSYVFYDPQLTHLVPNMATWMGELNIGINDFFSAGSTDINVAIPTLFELLMGRGIPPRAVNPGKDRNLDAIAGSTQGKGEAEYAYVVPALVGTIMGKDSRGRAHGILAYADLIEILIGIQRYSGDTFLPDNVSDASGTVKRTGRDLLGLFVPQIPAFTNATIWSVLQQFLNPAINEMYTCLRVNEVLRVVPQLVIRQLPFSTVLATDPDVTPYLELPRWKVDPALIHSVDLGRSDVLRTNFVHLTGQGPTLASTNQIAYQIARDGTYRDEQDIRRSGLRMDNQIVACSQEDAAKGPKRWMEIRTDFVMGQHLTLTGTVTLVGIQAPICEGDNLEIDGEVYHIESVTHSAEISMVGTKHFTTTLTVTHGMRDILASDGRPADDEFLYIGLDSNRKVSDLNTEDKYE